MKLIFFRTKSPYSWIIRFVTAGEGGFSLAHGWSHVGVVSPDGTVMVDSQAPYGVRDPVSLASVTTGVYAFGEIATPNEEAGYQWARYQVGKRYDFLALLGYLVPQWLTNALTSRRDWQDDTCWFCSEFAGAAAIQGGASLPRNIHRLSPNALAAWVGLH